MKYFVPRILLASLFVFASFTAASAQTRSKSAKVVPAKAEKIDPAADMQKFRQDFIKAAEESRASLVELSNTYETNLKKATEKQEQLKSLYADGLISRKEYEASGTDIADARAKAEEMKAQIAKADETIVAAR